MFYHFSTEDGEKKDKAKEEMPSEPATDEEKKVPKKRRGQKKEVPEAFMASFFAGLEVYQTKMLVSFCSRKTLDFSLGNMLSALPCMLKDIKCTCVFAELSGQELLQSPSPGFVCCLCHQFHSALL